MIALICFAREVYSYDWYLLTLPFRYFSEAVVVRKYWVVLRGKLIRGPPSGELSLNICFVRLAASHRPT